MSIYLAITNLFIGRNQIDHIHFRQKLFRDPEWRIQNASELNTFKTIRQFTLVCLNFFMFRLV